MQTKYTNPRYMAYAKENGKTPEEMMEHDKKEYPGGCMCGFTLWTHAKLREFEKISPKSFLYSRLCDQKAFSSFLGCDEFFE